MKIRQFIVGLTTSILFTICLFYFISITLPTTTQNEIIINENKIINDFQEWSKLMQEQDIGRTKLLNTPKNIPTVQFIKIPEIICPTKVRLGSLTDGGKWICNPWRISNHSTIVSLGIGGEVSFEKKLSELLKHYDKQYRIYGFDPIKEYERFYQSYKIKNAKIYPYKVVAQPNKNAKDQISLRQIQQTIIEKQSEDTNDDRSTIDVLKIDVEFSEYSVLGTWLSLFDIDDSPACQLLLEMHGYDNPTDTRRWISLLKTLGRHGFMLFSTEPNLLCTKFSLLRYKLTKPLALCTEYSFIHKSCLEQFGLRTRLLH